MVSRKKLFTSLLTVLISASISFSVVFAYSTYAQKVYQKKIYYKWGNFTHNYTTYFYAKYAWMTAVSDWPNADSTVSCIYQSSITSELRITYVVSSSFYGEMQMTYNASNSITEFYGELNCGNSKMSTPTIARSVANHELGHLLGLDDIYTGTAVMNTSRIRENIYLPQTDDINGEKSAYGY